MQKRAALRNFSHIVIALFLLQGPAFAEELGDNFIAVRPAGMGNAFTAISNDQNSIWTNPAGIARIRKARARSKVHYLSFPGIVAGANKEGQSSYAQLRTAQSSNNSAEASSNLKSVVDSSSKNQSTKPMWARAGANPAIFFESGPNRPAVFGIFTNSKMKLTLEENDEDINGHLESVTDVGGVLGMAFTNRSNRGNFGLQVRPTTRYAYDDKIPAEILIDQAQLQKRIKSDSNVGTGIGVDVGTMFTLADFWFPTLGLAILNLPTGCQEEYLNPFAEVRQTICGTKFGGTVNNPESLYLVDPTDIRIGVSMTPRLTRKLAMRFAMDLHNLYFTDGSNYYGLPGVDVQKQLHAGVELFIGNPMMINPLSVRFGYNQGFLTVGGSVRLGFLAVEVANYGKDISSSANPREDRRTIASISAEY